MNHILSLFVLLFMNFNWLLAQDKTTIIYVGDPMCSWCYGFAPEITEVKNHFSDLEFKTILGGLRPNGKETMADLGSFLKGHWEQVNEASNQPFTYAILDDKSFVYDTEPACRAVVAAREMNPNIEFNFFKGIQNLFYVENKNPGDVSSYTDLVKKFGLDFEKFKELFESEEIKEKTKADFSLASQMGISGFPAVVISKNGELHLAAKGYMKSDQLIKNINKIIK